MNIMLWNSDKGMSAWQGLVATACRSARGTVVIATLCLASIGICHTGPNLRSIDISPHTVLGGASSTGTVTLNSAAPTGGVAVTLASDNSAATVPSSVTVAAGQSSATFTVTTTVVTTSTEANIGATLGKRSVRTALQIDAPLSFTVAISPTTVGGGTRAQGTITLSSAAPMGGYFVTLSSSSSSAVIQPFTLILSGRKSTNFDVLTAPVSVSTNASITATIQGTSESASLTVNPPALSSLTVNPSSVGGGGSAFGVVALDGVSPQGGIVIMLSSSQGAATVPATVTIQAGHHQAAFTIGTTAVTTQSTATISATSGIISETATLTINPISLNSVAVFPSDVVGGNAVIGFVSLDGLAGSGGVVVSLSSSDSSVTLPASVKIPAGSSKARFAIATTAVATQTPVTVTATLGAVSQTATLVVNAVSLESVSLSPSRVVGGNNSTGTIRLSGPAPSGGLVVTLSSNSASVTVPATVTVPAGQNSVTFLAQTSAVTTRTKVQVTATSGTSTVVGNLNLAAS